MRWVCPSVTDAKTMQRLELRRPFVSGLAAGLVLSAPLFAQGANDDRVRADIDYARGLARDWQFIDLAEEVLDGVQSAGVSGDLEAELGLARCDVYAAGARNSRDASLRNELYEKALGAYQEFIDGNPFSELLPDAEQAYVDLANAYGQNLERQLAEAAGPEAEALRESLREMLLPAVALAQDLINALETTPEKTLADNRRMWNLMLVRGQLLLMMGRASTDGTVFFDDAVSILETLALAAEGDGAWFSLRAYLELGRVYAAQGAYQDSVDYIEYVIAEMIPRDPDLWVQLREEVDPEGLDGMFLMASLGMPDLIDSLGRTGRMPAACDWGLHFYNVWQLEGFQLNVPFGYIALLSIGHALVDTGGYVGGSLTGGELQWYATAQEVQAAQARRNQHTANAIALRIAQRVKEDNAGNSLQVLGEQLIAKVIEQPGVEVGVEVLIDAAMGSFNSRNYPEALDGFRRVQAELMASDEATQSQHMPQVLYNVGRALGSLERYHEAAMAFREGIVEYSGDPYYDPRNADGYAKAIEAVRNRAGNDPFLDALRSQAEDLVLANPLSDDPSEIIFRRGSEQYDAGNYVAARAEWETIEPGFELYEKAVAYIGLSYYKEGNRTQAVAIWRDYLEVYVVDPANEVEDGTLMAKNRREARAISTFYSGLVAAQTGEFQRAVDLLENFHTEFPSQTSYGPNALRTALLSHLQLGNFPAAKSVLSVMKSQYAGSDQTGAAAFAIYQALAQQEDAPPLELAELLSEANDLASSDPGFARWRKESTLWMEVEEWARAEELMKRLLDEYGADPERAESLDKYVRPDLGEVLLELGDVSGALAVLDPLVPAPDDLNTTLKPSRRTVEAWCRASAGWISGSGREIVEHPGVGGEANLDKALAWYHKLATNLQTKYTCDYYTLLFYREYATWQLSKLDDAKRDSVMTRMQQLQVTLGTNFVADDNTQDLVEICEGDDTLQRRFRWLWDEIQ